MPVLDLEKERDRILEICARYGATNVRVFGSYARGDATEESDLDLVFHPPEKMTLFGLSGLGLDLEDALLVPVDLVSDRGLKPETHGDILREAQAL